MSWILLNNTCVRTEDVRRIEIRQPVYIVTLIDGTRINVHSDATGGDWCIKIAADALKTVKDATKELDSE